MFSIKALHIFKKWQLTGDSANALHLNIHFALAQKRSENTNKPFCISALPTVFVHVCAHHVFTGGRLNAGVMLF